jgi:hypothetical protein
MALLHSGQDTVTQLSLRRAALDRLVAACHLATFVRKGDFCEACARQVRGAATRWSSPCFTGCVCVSVGWSTQQAGLGHAAPPPPHTLHTLHIQTIHTHHQCFIFTTTTHRTPQAWNAEAVHVQAAHARS